MSVKNELDLAYAAGIMDGEGCVGIYKKRETRVRLGYTYGLAVEITMCSSTIPMWLHKNFGGSLNDYAGRKENHKRIFVWQVVAQQAKSFLELILPYLKEKSGQAKIAVEFQEIKGNAEQPNQYRPKSIAVFEAEGILAAKIKALKS